MASKIVARIRRSRLTIYDDLADHPDLRLDHEQLERILNETLVGLDLDYKLRTRSKVLKSRVCEALGYPVPGSFRKTQPRFPGQDFDTYVQKADNLQIWNEEITASRRYVLVRVDEHSTVTKVRVVTGKMLEDLDPTGTLTHKYQAKAREPVLQSALVNSKDTGSVLRWNKTAKAARSAKLLSIAEIFSRIRQLLGTVIADPGRDQERNRGWALHQAVCRQLGLSASTDDGQFPDIREQLLEVKLQTASTIDLGLICPDSTEPLGDMPQFRHCDVRYAVYFGAPAAKNIRLEHLVVASGADFFKFFRRFEGRVKSAKLQIHLPRDFFA